MRRNTTATMEESFLLISDHLMAWQLLGCVTGDSKEKKKVATNTKEINVTIEFIFHHAGKQRSYFKFMLL